MRQIFQFHKYWRHVSAPRTTEFAFKLKKTTYFIINKFLIQPTLAWNLHHTSELKSFSWRQLELPRLSIKILMTLYYLYPKDYKYFSWIHIAHWHSGISWYVSGKQKNGPEAPQLHRQIRPGLILPLGKWMLSCPAWTEQGLERPSYLQI